VNLGPLHGFLALTLAAGVSLALAAGKSRRSPGPSGEFSSVNFWSDNAEEAIDAAQRRRDGTPYAFVAGPSWVDRRRRKSIPVFACQGGTSADYRRGSLGRDGMIVLVDLDRQRLLIASVDHKEYSYEPAPEPALEPAKVVSDSDDQRFGSSCTPLDLAKLFPHLLQGGGLYRVLALHPGGLAEGFELEVGKSRGEYEKAPGNAPPLVGQGNPMPAEAWTAETRNESGATAFDLTLDPASDRRTLLASMPVASPRAVRTLHLLGISPKWSLVAWSLVLPIDHGATRFRLDLGRLFPALDSSGGLLVGIDGNGGVAVVAVGREGGAPKAR